MDKNLAARIRKPISVVSAVAIAAGAMVSFQATSAQAADDLITLNTTGGTNATDGIKVSYQSGKYQVHKNGSGQIYSPITVPGSINSIMLAVDAGAGCVVFSSFDSLGTCSRQEWTETDTTGSDTTGSGSFTSVLTGTTNGKTYKVHLKNDYIKPNNFFTQEYRVEIPEGNEKDVRLYYGLDSYLSGGDKGPGYYLPSPQEVGVNKAGQKMAFRYASGPSWSSYYSARYTGTMGSPGPGGGTDYANTIDVDPNTDNGFATNWNVGSAPGMSPRMRNFFAFSSPGVPDAPAAPQAVVDGDDVDVTWEASDDTLDYIVASVPGEGTCEATAPATTCQVEDLPAGVYRFTVAPRNVSGPGFPSTPSNPVVVGNVPQHQFSYSANDATGGSVPAGASQEYEQWPIAVLDNSNDLVRPGYEFAGWNTKADGTGSTYSAGSEFEMPDHDATLYAKWVPGPDTPHQPPAPTATAQPDGGVKIRFTAPADGPAPTHYTATSQPGGKTCTVAATANPLECTVTGLAPNTKYKFTSTASKGDFSSPVSAPSNEVTTAGTRPTPVGPTAKPAKPKKVKVSGNAFSKTKKVSWAKGPTTGARAVSHYRIKLNIQRCPTIILNKKLSKNTTSYTFKRSWLLKKKNSTCARSTRGEVRSNKVKYRVRVEAVNSKGTATTVSSFTIKRKR